MVPSSVICKKTDWHEIAELGREPPIKVLRESSNEITTNKDVEHTRDERELLASCYSFGVIPSRSKSLDRMSHAFPVLSQLLIRRWKSPPPLIDNSVLGKRCRGFEFLPMPSHPFRLRRDFVLPSFEGCWECEVI